jgi:2,3-dihydroxyphenylpropionate 1,2-dioxygenase
MADGIGVVGAAAVPHAPQFFTLPDTEDRHQVERVRATMQRIGDELRGLGPDAVVIVANDHLTRIHRCHDGALAPMHAISRPGFCAPRSRTSSALTPVLGADPRSGAPGHQFARRESVDPGLKNFLLHCVPAFAVHRGPRASGSFAGRSFGWPVHSEMATALVQSLQDQGFDPAVSMNAPIGYEFGIPLTFMGFPEDTPLLPIFINSYVPPQPSPDRCYALGQAIARSARLQGWRIVVVASGGLSHYPGTERYGQPDVQTDEALLARIRAGDLRALLGMDAASLDETGNVEARSWIVLAGALGQRAPQLVAMEPSWHHNYAIVSWTQPDGRPPPRLHYPVPRSDQLPLYEALYALLTDHAADRAFLEAPAAFADRYPLGSDERAALLALDEARLRDLGVHPLLGFLARLEVDLARRSGA